MGGTDDESNLVKLTAQDHIIAHILLSKIYPDNNDIVFSAMSMTKIKDRYQLISEKLFSVNLLTDLRIAAGNSRKGEGNPMYGKKHSQTTKDLISRKIQEESSLKSRGPLNKDEKSYSHRRMEKQYFKRNDRTKTST